MSRASAPKYATAESSPKDVDMCWVAASFSRAAKTYDESATLQHDVGYRLIQRLTRSGMQPRRLLDIGSGTGLTTAALADHLNAREVVGLDIAPGMVSLARSRARRGSPVRYLCGDAASLPLASNCCDAVFSNMTLQWCHDLKQAARQVKRVLKPQGLFVFSTLGPGTLQELRESWQGVDAHAHVNRFLACSQVEDSLLEAGLEPVAVESAPETLWYTRAADLMRDLKAIGANNHNVGRSPGLMGKRALQAVADNYERFRTPSGWLPATYEVIIAEARPAAPTSQR